MKFYLAHPFDTREEMRRWELHIEAKLGIELVNPFYDIQRTDVGEIDTGEKGRYDLDYMELVTRDLNAVLGAEGVIAYINGALSYGTIMEIVYAHTFGRPVIIICTNGHEEHPWLKFHAERIVTSIAEAEDLLSELADGEDNIWN